MAQQRAAADEMEQPSLLWTGTDGAPPLQALAAEKLAAHRRRRVSAEDGGREQSQRGEPQPVDAVAARVRDAVAARYRQSVSYREFLEANAAREAEAVPTVVEAVRAVPAVADAAVFSFAEEEAPAVAASNLRVRMHDDGRVAETLPAVRLPSTDVHAAEELAVLEEEIEFRFAPEFAEHHIDALPLQANIIEFPRQIVAPRKARPRLAEGPLRGNTVVEERLRAEDMVAQDAPPQLRIFEVEPEFISVEPVVAEAMTAPAWQTSESDVSAVASHNAAAKALGTEAPKLKSVATLEMRLMAACVDAFWVGLGFVACAAATGYFAAPALLQLPRWQLGAGAAVVFAGLAACYALVCFTFNEATPGMIYAEIGLCTFDDENPTRAAMRKRLLATLVAAAPLGLGLLWAAMDSERLAWNDRLSRMYLRSY